MHAVADRASCVVAADRALLADRRVPEAAIDVVSWPIVTPASIERGGGVDDRHPGAHVVLDGCGRCASVRGPRASSTRSLTPSVERGVVDHVGGDVWPAAGAGRTSGR